MIPDPHEPPVVTDAQVLRAIARLVRRLTDAATSEQGTRITRGEAVTFLHAIARIDEQAAKWTGVQ